METNDYFCAYEWKDFLRPPMFKVVYSEEVISFLQTVDEKARSKILFNINKSKYVLDDSLFKKLSGADYWEFRTKYAKQSYRILAFWDKEETALVVTTHGFIKKTQKMSGKELVRANAIRERYYSKKEQEQYE